jgi:mono/diheme cytochrome c family protein
MTFKRIVGVAQILAAVFALVTVVMLFTRQPPSASGVAAPSSSSGGAAPSSAMGQTVFAAKCASCHGVRGEGALAPQLAGVVESSYPNAEDEIAVVAKGKGTMPAFEASLTPEEIKAVVEHTRTGL